MSGKKNRNSLLAFLVGLLLLGAGLYMISSRVVVTSDFGLLRMGGIGVPFGLTTVPFLLGVIWLFVRPDELLPKIVIVLGVVFILAAVIMSVRFRFARTTLFEYALMFGMAAAGSGLLLRTLFAPKTKSSKEDQEEE